MDDLISRKAAVDAMWKIRRQQQMLDDTHKADLVMQGIYLAEKALEQLPSAQPERWIPVSEKLPEVREWVLCQCRAGIMDVLRLTEDGDWNKNYPHAEYMSGFVIAWMPLPEPYYGDAERRTNE